MEYIRMYFCPEIIVLMGGKKKYVTVSNIKIEG